ncbi:hypothetical protein ILYODFUR_034915 [Ilyodon furcidens]|uniref:Uncharacterized protein n=1 Tax=Ilyodon furcidens TaxID=33524 RepID=A0ABV0SS11_9TELE
MIKIFKNHHSPNETVTASHKSPTSTNTALIIKHIYLFIKAKANSSNKIICTQEIVSTLFYAVRTCSDSGLFLCTVSVCLLIIAVLKDFRGLFSPAPPRPAPYSCLTCSTCLPGFISCSLADKQHQIIESLVW